jgi:uncharacterized membrane protein
MIIMALDHVRDYFHADAFSYDPLDFAHTNGLLFFTRWITHFCAPVFVFLAGTSAFLSGQRKTKKELSLFLIKRGLWLVFLELTVLNFGWMFNTSFPTFPLIVIWALGISMIALAMLIHLPKILILIIGIVLVAGHNSLDTIRVEGNGMKAVGWSILHQPNLFFDSKMIGGKNLFVGYPVIPWIGLMALGYCFGQLYTAAFDVAKRRRWLLLLGFSCITLFLILRLTQWYGDSFHWSTQTSSLFTFLSVLNTTKYPPSLLYLLMTIGPALLFLAFTEAPLNRFRNVIATYGRVPFFYYIIHIYLIHLLAMLATLFCGHKPSDMIVSVWVNFEPQLQGYGFSLGIVYIVWILLVASLYPLCRWYDKYKASHRDKWWVSYI